MLDRGTPPGFMPETIPSMRDRFPLAVQHVISRGMNALDDVPCPVFERMHLFDFVGGLRLCAFVVDATRFYREISSCPVPAMFYPMIQRDSELEMRLRTNRAAFEPLFESVITSCILAICPYEIELPMQISAHMRTVEGRQIQIASIGVTSSWPVWGEAVRIMQDYGLETSNACSKVNAEVVHRCGKRLYKGAPRPGDN